MGRAMSIVPKLCPLDGAVYVCMYRWGGGGGERGNILMITS